MAHKADWGIAMGKTMGRADYLPFGPGLQAASIRSWHVPCACLACKATVARVIERSPQPAYRFPACVRVAHQSTSSRCSAHGAASPP
eukprot:CAMPEP_0174725688 /NCGR_PEP_ID=MMETSP1094-20130205/46183_1 /TAXON_ID=156173 /ORGANISM="Chrysochromulina brevifilum, Strain UTEX LB 985" /LENGTH=86 /DNA_ID=CAMNT_0015927143 /DNA_START=85 /DNA_END=341 /DNA_ORIENTATION=+